MLLNALSARIGNFASVPGTLHSCQPAAWNQTSMSPPCRMPVRRPRCSQRLRSNRTANQCCQFGGASNGTLGGLCLRNRERSLNKIACWGLGFNARCCPPAKRRLALRWKTTRLGSTQASPPRGWQYLELHHDRTQQSSRTLDLGHHGPEFSKTAWKFNYSNTGESLLNGSLGYA